MKVLLYTIEMVKGVERLMPWRTLVEVAKYASEDMEIAICSAQAPEDVPEDVREHEGVKIYSINYGTKALRQFIADGGWDAVYYPITYRQGLKSMSELASVKARKIAYIPGGICPLSGSLKLVQMGETKRALPYLLDTIIPHSLIAKKLQKVGFKGIVCQAPLTAENAQHSGWKQVVCALPGNSPANCDSFDRSYYERFGLQGQKFLLFSGAPAPTRGAILAMKAFDKIAGQLTDIKMVMLMRRDVSSDFKAFNKAASEIKHKNRFVISYDNLTHDQLFYFFRSAWAVMLPFLIIPSEIPLTYLEVMELGTPIISFENGGTTDYLNSGLKIAKRRTVASLAKAIVEICSNEAERNHLSTNAKEIMSNHPTWNSTSKKWLSVL